MIRRRRHEEPENHERWLVSYADFITLMFAFFIVMYATAQRNPDKEKEFEKSVRKYFYSIIQNMTGKSMYNETDFGNRPIAPPMDAPASSGGPSSEAADRLAQKIKNSDETGDLSRAVEEVYHDIYGVRIRMLASAIFELGSAKLSETSLGALKTLGDVLKGVDGKIIIEGHTDNLPIKSAKYPSNWELSSDRAAKILRYLSEFHDIDANRMVVVAYADSKPAYPNDSAKNRAKNRRIEILITNAPAPGM